jgi:hypothetical protein
MKERMREAAKRPQYARRAERRVMDAAADVQRLQAQPAQADARHDAHHISGLLFLLPNQRKRRSPLELKRKRSLFSAQRKRMWMNADSLTVSVIWETCQRVY